MPRRVVDAKIKELIELTDSPILIAIEEGGSSGFRIVSSGEKRNEGDQIKLAKMIFKSGDIDSFIRELIKDAEEKGHNSIFLKMLGIPEKPKF